MQTVRLRGTHGRHSDHGSRPCPRSEVGSRWATSPPSQAGPSGLVRVRVRDGFRVRVRVSTAGPGGLRVRATGPSDLPPRGRHPGHQLAAGAAARPPPRPAPVRGGAPAASPRRRASWIHVLISCAPAASQRRRPGGRRATDLARRSPGQRGARCRRGWRRGPPAARRGPRAAPRAAVARPAGSAARRAAARTWLGFVLGLRVRVRVRVRFRVRVKGRVRV